VDLTFTDLRQLADVAAGLSNIIHRHGLCRITGEFVEAVKYRAQLCECVEGAMGSLRKFEALLLSEQPLNEPVQLLSADEGYTGEAFPGLRGSRREPIGMARSFPDAGKAGSTDPSRGSATAH
jgi:hypothetical protein